MERHTQATLQLALKLRTVITTKLHFTDVHMEWQISEGTFGIVTREFRGNSVAIKRLNEVTTCDEAMAGFTKEVAMLDKFRCDQIVHFYGACTIPNHMHDGGVCAVRFARGLHQEAGRAGCQNQSEADARRCERTGLSSLERRPTP